MRKAIVVVRAAVTRTCPCAWSPSVCGPATGGTTTKTNFVQKLLTVHMDRISELRVINTLCNATTSQQAATQDLAGEVDLIDYH